MISDVKMVNYESILDFYRNLERIDTSDGENDEMRKKQLGKNSLFRSFVHHESKDTFLIA